MNPALEGYVAAVLDAAGPERATPLADDLAAVAHLVADNTALRAALTDTAVEGRARRAVVEDLLEDRVSAEARRAAGFAAAAVAAPDVPAAMDWLADRARRVASGQPVDEELLGHLAARRRVGGFAAAVFEDADVASLEEIEDELFRFARTVEGAPALRTALTDRDLALAARQGVVDQLLAGKVQPATLRLVAYVLRGGRARDTLGTLYWLVEETARARGWRVAQVHAAAQVDEAQQRELSEVLARVTGSPVELQVSVDPKLLAGAVVRVGDLQVDATARGRLDALRERLAAGGWEPGRGGATRVAGTSGTRSDD